jgi:hypothetical protein
MPHGVCVFDVDGTLTDAPRRVGTDGRTLSEPVQACLEAGYLVGVATASERAWQSYCTLDGRATGKEAWATDDLCGGLAAVGFKTFCSTGGGGSRAQIGGVPLEQLPREARAEFARLRDGGEHGAQKGWAMEYVRRLSFPELASSQMLLFDNEPRWVADAHRSGVSAYCVGDLCSGEEVPFTRFDFRGVTETLRCHSSSSLPSVNSTTSVLETTK